VFVSYPSSPPLACVCAGQRDVVMICPTSPQNTHTHTNTHPRHSQPNMSFHSASLRSPSLSLVHTHPIHPHVHNSTPTAACTADSLLTPHHPHPHHQSIHNPTPTYTINPSTTQHQHHHSGVYYWQRASREDTVQVKLETPDNEETTEIVAVGNVRAWASSWV
jgi:hypothetical protein